MLLIMFLQVCCVNCCFSCFIPCITLIINLHLLLLQFQLLLLLDGLLLLQLLLQLLLLLHWLLLLQLWHNVFLHLLFVLFVLRSLQLEFQQQFHLLQFQKEQLLQSLVGCNGSINNTTKPTHKFWTLDNTCMITTWHALIWDMCPSSCSRHLSFFLHGQCLLQLFSACMSFPGSSQNHLIPNKTPSQ